MTNGRAEMVQVFEPRSDVLQLKGGLNISSTHLAGTN